jgi:hypothetical protein
MAGMLVADGYGEDEAHQRATLVYALIQGALVLAKGRRSAAPLDDLRQSLPRLIGEPLALTAAVKPKRAKAPTARRRATARP